MYNTDDLETSFLFDLQKPPPSFACTRFDTVSVGKRSAGSWVKLTRILSDPLQRAGKRAGFLVTPLPSWLATEGGSCWGCLGTQIKISLPGSAQHGPVSGHIAMLVYGFIKIFMHIAHICSSKLGVLVKR